MSITIILRYDEQNIMMMREPSLHIMLQYSVHHLVMRLCMHSTFRTHFMSGGARKPAEDRQKTNVR